MALSSLEKLPYFVRTDPEVLATAAALCAAAEAYAAASPTWAEARAAAYMPLGNAVCTATVAHKAAVDVALNREHDREQAEDEEDAHLYMASIQDGLHPSAGWCPACESGVDRSLDVCAYCGCYLP